MTNFRPMLASPANLKRLTFPLLASAKLDGVRAVVRNGVVYSRSNKPIPNRNVQEAFRNCEYFDGELISGSPTSKTVYRDTVSTVMSHCCKISPVAFHVFDYVKNLSEPYIKRQLELEANFNWWAAPNVCLLPQWTVNNLEELRALEDQALQDGYEGLILRGMLSPYKCGRSTVEEGYLLKLKRFRDAEAVVIGFEEKMHNANEAITNELGYTSRSSHQENQIPMGTLGALICDFNGVVFKIGTGFTEDERQDIWNNRRHVWGRLVKFKYFPVGVKDAPRHPVFLGWRSANDL